MAEPLSDGTDHETANFSDPPEVTVGVEGLAGTPAGVAVAAADHGPSPLAFSARTRTW